MIGIIFYNFDKKLNLYLRKNTKELYEDILINEQIVVDISKNISPLFKSYNYDFKNTTLILNIKKYEDIYNKIKNNKDTIKITLKHFNDKIIHKNVKHKRIKSFDLINNLNLIDMNYKYRKVLLIN